MRDQHALARFEIILLRPTSDLGIRLHAARKFLRACRHVETADAFHAMQRREWRKGGAHTVHALAELNANSLRKNLTPEEEHRIVVAVADKEKPRKISEVSGGRGKKGGNSASAAKLGIDEGTVRNARKHVDALDALPFFNGESGFRGPREAIAGRSGEGVELPEGLILNACCHIFR